jgi:hypothetical protein
MTVTVCRQAMISGCSEDKTSAAGRSVKIRQNYEINQNTLAVAGMFETFLNNWSTYVNI